MSSISPQKNPPTKDEIAFCAYLLWEKEGRPHGRDLVHWLQAEEQLLADYALDAGMLDPGVAAQLDLRKLQRKLRNRGKEIKTK